MTTTPEGLDASITSRDMVFEADVSAVTRFSSWPR
jgi:hypothetical protein